MKPRQRQLFFCAPCCRAHPNVDTINECGRDITPQSFVRNTGVFTDNSLCMSTQVARTCQGAYFQLHKIAEIRNCSTTHACKTIVHGLVTSGLDYENAVLFGINVRLIQKLQMVQNSAARLITSTAATISTSRPPSLRSTGCRSDGESTIRFVC